MLWRLSLIIVWTPVILFFAEALPVFALQGEMVTETAVDEAM
jgi:hypothetical protein